MDLTRLAVDAGQFINRAVQYTGESIGQADKTELDTGLEELLARADVTKTCTDKIISQTEVLLQPNPGARFEERLYEHLDWTVSPRPRALELVGEQMSQAGLEVGSNTPYGTALLRCGEAQKQLGEAERKFVQSANIHFLTPLRSFTEGEYRAIQDERRMLLNKRLDLDVAKTRLRRALEADREDRNLNAHPLDDDYLSHVSYMFSFLRVRWLKIWAQQISQAEMELRICQSLFDRQSEITRGVLQGISNTHTNHMRSLTDFVEAQACYFDQCNQHAQELQKQLSSVPAVLCSNNWQSAISDQPSASNRVAGEPAGLNQVRHLPEFDQDSWTESPPTGTGGAGSSAAAQPLDQTNNNNNNDSGVCSGESQEMGRRSAAGQALSDVRTSNSDGLAAEAISAPGRATTFTPPVRRAVPAASSRPSQPGGAASGSASAGEGVAAGEPEATEETADERPAVNGGAAREPSSSSSSSSSAGAGCGSVRAGVWGRRV